MYHTLCTISVQPLRKNLYDYSSILRERGFYTNGYMTLIKTKDLQVCFMDVWIAFLMDRVCLVWVCMLVSVLQVLTCALRWVSSELSRCFRGSVLQIGSQMFP